METPYVQLLIKTARQEYTIYKDHIETDPVLSVQIKHYWENIGLAFPGVGTAWSAVFISWCVKQAGANAGEFKFSAAHSEFVYKAIKNKEAGTGVFKGYNFNELIPETGDILQNNRGGNTYDYAYASIHSNYFSHSAIIIEKGNDATGAYIITVGGNESNTVMTKKIRLGADGKILQRTASPFICLIKDLK